MSPGWLTDERSTSPRKGRNNNRRERGTGKVAFAACGLSALSAYTSLAHSPLHPSPSASTFIHVLICEEKGKSGR